MLIEVVNGRFVHIENVYVKGRYFLNKHTKLYQIYNCCSMLFIAKEVHFNKVPLGTEQAQACITNN